LNICVGKGKFHEVVFQLESSDVADVFVRCITRASSITVDDVYETSKTSRGNLGRGRFACVKVARRRIPKPKIKPKNKPPKPPPRAIKIIDKLEFWRRCSAGRERYDTLVREIVIQTTISENLSYKGGPPGERAKRVFGGESYGGVRMV